MCRCTILLMNLREEWRQQTVTAHAEEHTTLAKQSNHDYRTISEEDGHDDGTIQPWIGGCNHTCCIRRSHVVDGNGYRRDALLSVKVGVVRYTGHDMSKENVKYGR